MGEQLKIFGIPVVTVDGMPIDQIALVSGGLRIPELREIDPERILAVLKGITPSEDDDEE